MQITPKALYPGDTIEVGVTHEIKIDGETSWIKYGVHSKVQEGETAEAARLRCSEHVNDGVLRVVHETVEKVRA